MVMRFMMAFAILSPMVFGQETGEDAKDAKDVKDRAVYKPEYKDPDLKDLEARSRDRAKERDSITLKIRQAQASRKEKEEEAKKKLRTTFEGVKKPESLDAFQQVFHFPPIRQYLTGSCWCFSTTSFMESEIQRVSGREIKLSEMYTVYFEFLEKARRFVQERGDSFFSEGSEGNVVFMIWNKYGILPAEAYRGELNPDGRFDHSILAEEMRAFLSYYVRTKDLWEEEYVLESLRLIMDRYMGRPPERFAFEGGETTPALFFQDVVKLDLKEYVCLMSTLSEPFYEYGEYAVKANWWRSKDYYNVPLDVFYQIVKEAVRNGYSVKLNGDVSEPGYDGFQDAAIIPTFDIPEACIDQDARELRIVNGATEDDHDVHLVGYADIEGKDWFLVKDSASSAQHGKFKGYWFYRGDYIKLKTLTIIVHRDVVKNVIPHFK